MTFTVLWKPSAARRLAEIWLGAPDRTAVTMAADAIDLLLKVNPQERGESRDGNHRILIVGPLVVVFEVHESDRVAFVLSVRHVPAASNEAE